MDLSTWTNVAFAGVAVIGTILAGVSAAAVVRTRSPRMVVVATAFALIAIQGIVVGVSLFGGGADPSTLLFLSALFEAGVLVALFLATLVR